MDRSACVEGECAWVSVQPNSAQTLFCDRRHLSRALLQMLRPVRLGHDRDGIAHDPDAYVMADSGKVGQSGSRRVEHSGKMEGMCWPNWVWHLRGVAVERIEVLVQVVPREVCWMMAHRSKLW